MPRIARIVGVGLPHHITQRGNYRQTVFYSDSGRRLYLKYLSETSKKYGVSILAYCLMRNHIHLIAIPKRKDSFAKTFNTVNMRYSQYCNAVRGTVGHLWQSRYYSCVLDPLHLLAATRYVERNPVSAGLIEHPVHWRWSSANAHCGGRCEYNLDLEKMWPIIGVEKDKWADFISESNSVEEIETIRRQTISGRPLGTGEFIKQLEAEAGKRLHANHVGRPKKKVEIGSCP